LLRQCRDHWQRTWEAVQVPPGLRHRFDRASEEKTEDNTRVEKTTSRQVVTLELSTFRAIEVVRTSPDQQRRHSSLLAGLVPKGGKYGYDLITHVGIQTFLQGRQLQDVAAELCPLTVPLSSLHDLLMKFLYYFGHWHRQYAAPRLRERFRQQGHTTWLMDATVEPGTPAYFGLLEAEGRVCLEAWKIPTEHADDIVPCLQEATQRFGAPSEVLHDLGDAMMAACDAAWKGTVPHRVCQFHLLRDIGEDLYAGPQALLSELVRKLKLHPRMKEQRRGQTEWLRGHTEDPTALAQLLRGQTTDTSPEVLGREVVLALHQWILDYASDGRRQGYPFDPYLLYFHRRVVRAAAALEQLLAEPAVCQCAPQVLGNLSRMLRDYLMDTGVIAAAQEFEQAWQLFTRLRTAMRLSAQGESPLHDPYLLKLEEGMMMKQALESLRQECREKAEQLTDAKHAKPWRTVVTHLDRYWNMLFGRNGSQRTTNSLESHWCTTKRRCRKRHGRNKLTRDFQCLPPEIMLVPNLENPQYVEQILGGLGQLDAKLAEAGQTAPPWTEWWSRQKPVQTARLPRRLLRQENLIDKLVVAYDNQCQREGAEAA
jgi:hypothetical protein